MERRTFIAAIAAGVAVVAAGAIAVAELSPTGAPAVSGRVPTHPGTDIPISSPLATPDPLATQAGGFTPVPTPVETGAGEPGGEPTPGPSSYPYAVFTKADITRARVPHGVIERLPGTTNHIALTVDDGNNSRVVKHYGEFARDTGMRLTFFLNGLRPSWTDNAELLRPMVESGQIQLGNHTWSHPDLTKLKDAEIVDELSRNDKFIRNTYGAQAKPFYRPPFGYYNDRVVNVAADLGYSTAVMWFGTLLDAVFIPKPTLRKFAKQYLEPGRIVIGHANATTVTSQFGFIDKLLHERNLVPVTLNDIWSH